MAKKKSAAYKRTKRSISRKKGMSKSTAEKFAKNAQRRAKKRKR